MSSGGRRKPMPPVAGGNKPLPPPPDVVDNNSPPPPLPSRPGRVPFPTPGFQEPTDCYDEFQEDGMDNYDEFLGTTIQEPTDNYDEFQGTISQVEPSENYDDFQGTVETKRYGDEPSETYEAVGEDQNTWKSQEIPPALPPSRPAAKTNRPPALPSLSNRRPLPSGPSDNYDDFQGTKGDDPTESYDDFQGTKEIKQYQDEPSETYEAVGEDQYPSWKNQNSDQPPALPPSRPNTKSGQPPPIPSLTNRPPIKKNPPAVIKTEPSEVYEELGMNGIDEPEETYEEAAELPPPLPSSRPKNTSIPPIPGVSGRPAIGKPKAAVIPQDTYEVTTDGPTDVYEESQEGPDEEYDEPIAKATTRSAIPPPPVLPSRNQTVNKPVLASRTPKTDLPKKVAGVGEKVQPAIGLDTLKGVKLKSVAQNTPKKVDPVSSKESSKEYQDTGSIASRIKQMQSRLSETKGTNQQPASKTSPKFSSKNSFSPVSSTSSNKSTSDDRPSLPARPSDKDRPPLPSRSSEDSGSSQELSPRSHTKVTKPPPSPKKDIPVFEEPEEIYDEASSLPLPPQDPLELFPWYHGPIERTEGNKRLNKIEKDGTFLVRKSKTGGEKQPFTLMVLYNKHVNNLKVRKTNQGKLALGDPKPDELTFKDIEAVITHHQSNEVILFGASSGKTKLLHAAPKV